VAGLALTAGLLHAQWPQWRGPARDGAQANWQAPARWPKSLTPAWSVGVGVGHAAPVVSDGRAYVFARQGEQEVLQALDLASGRALWRQAYDQPYEMHPAARDHGPGPKSTPVLAAGKLCTFGIAGVVSCHEAASGRLLWRKDFKGRVSTPAPAFGTAQSPLVHAGLLYVHVGNDVTGALLALDLASGRERWAWQGDGPGYASPLLVELGGTRQLVTFSHHALVSFDPERGTLLWKLPFKTPYDQNAVTPLVAAGRLVYSGLEQGLRAAEPVRAGAHLRLEPRWENRDVGLYMSSPVLVGGRLFGFSHRNRGEFFGLDANDGRLLWRSPGRQADNASLIAAGGLILATTTEGTLVIWRADAPGWAPLATYTVTDSPLWAHPALADRLLLVKDLDTLRALRLE
jgi:outer membrane protein assembly factor BamB